MALIPLQRNPAAPPRVPWLSLGFRPFFFGAGLFAVVTMAAWMAIYIGRHPLDVAPLAPSQWHAHEMIYGYAMAVIAGFLLTAVENWTGRETLRGAPLALFFSVWAVARALYLAGARFLPIAGALDVLFALTLAVVVVVPVVQARQWRQMAIVAKIVTLSVGEILFYLGALGRFPRGVYLGLYGGFFLVIGLIMTMGARIIPPFIQNGVEEEVRIPSRRWIGIASLAFYLVFFFSEMAGGDGWVTPASCAALFVVTTIRLADWHTPGLWKRPLLWSLYLAFVFIDLGFLLFAARPWLGWPAFIPLHAMAVGGIGLVTLGMMARVSLGHSGRDIRRPPRTVGWAAGALGVAAIVRIFVTMAAPARYAAAIAVAQAFWIAAFLLFLASFTPVFFSRNLDGA